MKVALHPHLDSTLSNLKGGWSGHFFKSDSRLNQLYKSTLMT